ncbi:hypothetical protein, partial [Bacillus velezensis]|uniref:hypothetical protein n=1 Tax=Bacillus velezensis TaxID=492670 RepID=UPI002E238417|nr:hypothetical protein [Bacillus velezensis]
SNQTKQPITDKLSAIGCLKGVLTPVSKTGGSPNPPGCFFIAHSSDGRFVRAFSENLFDGI